MNKYFEYDIPSIMPSYINSAKKSQWEEMSLRIRSRMDKLEEALTLTGIAGEQFAIVAKPFFDTLDNNGCSILDSMTSIQIADLVKPAGQYTAYTPREEWPNSCVIVDAAFVSNAEWVVLRGLGIGGSESALGEGYSTLSEIYHRKRETELVQEEGKELIFSYGHAIEPLVIQEFCRRTGAVVIPETRMCATRS